MSEHCRSAASLMIKDVNSDEVLVVVVDLAGDLRADVQEVGRSEPDKNGNFDLVIEASCKDWKNNRGQSSGVCLRERLKQRGVENTELIQSCICHPQESQEETP